MKINWTYFWLGFAIVWFAIMCYASAVSIAECREAGGVAARGTTKVLCLKRDAVIEVSRQ